MMEKIFKDNYKGNEESLQECLLILKKNGCTQIDAIRLLINELGISLKEADKIVLISAAWQTEKDCTLRLRNDFEAGLSD